MNAITFLRSAAQAASECSADTRTQNAALIATPGAKIVVAANLYPVQSWSRFTDAPEKYTYMEHAERMAIYEAARLGIATDGSIMYCPWFACPECARAIIAAGIRLVIGCSRLRALTPERWRSRIATADRMLEDAGVEVRMVSETLGARIRFDGNEVEV